MSAEHPEQFRPPLSNDDSERATVPESGAGRLSPVVDPESKSDLRTDAVSGDAYAVAASPDTARATSGDFSWFPWTKAPNYANALAVDPDELWRNPGNRGIEQDSDYIQDHRTVRETMVQAFMSGELYRSRESFVGFLKAAQRFLAEGGHDRGLLSEDQYGEFNDTPGRVRNIRIIQSREIAGIAQRFDDPYGRPLRLMLGKPNTESISVVELPGISPDNLPYDVVRYDAVGDVRDRNIEDTSQSGYEFVYPDVQGVDEYMQQAWLLGVGIERAIKSGTANETELRQMIGRQYQYIAAARPFKHVNNSLFMHLPNMQVKLLGNEGMAHGNMDLAAQRMQPDGFARYFVARVTGRAS